MNMLIRAWMMLALLNRELEKTIKDSQTQPLTQEQLFKPILSKYRVLPHDMGFRHHLPNYRYLSFIELNVTNWLTKCLHVKGRTTDSTGKLYWILAMQEMVYLKEVKFLDKITVISTLEGWDKKYIYFQHHFMVKNTLMAIGLSKIVLMDKQKKPFCPEVFDMAGKHITEVMDTWNMNQTAIKSQKLQ